MNIEGIKKVGIVGAGTMGAGVAEIFAQFGYTVILYNRSKAGMERAVERLQSKIAVAPAPIETETDTAEAKIYTTRDLTELTQVDLISESIAENLEVKQDIFRQLDEICNAKTIFTTNTSGLSISQIATAVSHPERFAGVHFFNPPEIVPAVEVIKGAETSDVTCEDLIDLLRLMKKQPILVQKDVPGFVASRLQFAVVREALHLVEEGIASPADIDAVMKHGLGLRWALLGPLEIADLGGLDIFNTVGSYVAKSMSNATDSPKVLQDLVAAGKLGAKTGSGFYEYPPGKANALIAERDEKLLEILRLKSRDSS
jgi:3-hydroxybutyryl-CoA dehydrogenase